MPGNGGEKKQVSENALRKRDTIQNRAQKGTSSTTRRGAGTMPREIKGTGSHHPGPQRGWKASEVQYGTSNKPRTSGAAGDMDSKRIWMAWEYRLLANNLAGYMYPSEVLLRDMDVFGIWMA
jgi:hypothetical protein